MLKGFDDDDARILHTFNFETFSECEPMLGSLDVPPLITPSGYIF
jgi:hypothetical protein